MGELQPPKPFGCLEGHIVYLKPEEIHEEMFCKELENHGENFTWCGLPLKEIKDMPED